jgi:hypothetical protein
MSNSSDGAHEWFAYNRSEFSSMCCVPDTCTVEYAFVATVALVMRAKSAPAGSDTSDVALEPKAAADLCTHTNRVRSGPAQAGMGFASEAGAVREEVAMVEKPLAVLQGTPFIWAGGSGVGDIAGRKLIVNCGGLEET